MHQSGEFDNYVHSTRLKIHTNSFSTWLFVILFNGELQRHAEYVLNDAFLIGVKYSSFTVSYCNLAERVVENKDTARCIRREQNARLDVTRLVSVIKYSTIAHLLSFKF